MGLNKNKSAITHVEVRFKEIDRFFDVHGSTDPRFSARVPVMDKNGDPKIIVYDYDLSYDPMLGIPPKRGNASDENGDPVYDQFRELPGWYRTIRTYGEWYFVRTFARWKSQKVDRKYVYVWAADDKQGGGMRLVRELYFQGGKFKLIDFDSKDRKPAGRAVEGLVLDLISFPDATPKRVHYFFLLAKYQIPRKRLDEMMKDVPARGMRLFDEFYTDFPESPKNDSSAEPKQHGRELPPKLIFPIHLLDPFKEALQRSERYRNALHRWQESLAVLSKDPEYVLAKGIEYLKDNGSQPCPDVLSGTYYDYLHKREKEADRRLTVTFNLAVDLVQWIGNGEVREKIAFKNGVRTDTYYSDSSQRFTSTEDKGPDQWHSQYCQALRDYATPDGDLTADTKVAHAIAELICAVVDELDQSPFGDAWLKDRVKKGIEGDIDKVAPAGFEFFFLSKLAKSGGEEDDRKGAEGGEAGKGEGGESKEGGEHSSGGISPDVARKGSETAKGVVTLLLKTVGKHWVEHYRKDALSNLQSWYKAKHGITLERKAAGIPRKKRSKFTADAKRDFRAAKKLGVEKLELKPGGIEKWEYGIRQLKYLQVGLEMVNLCFAIEEARDGDKWKVLEALGSAMDASKALFEAIHSEDYFSEVEEAAGTASKVFRVVGFVSAAIDIITGAHGIYESKTLAGQVSEGMKTLGAALVFGGAFAEEHPAGIAVMAAGAGLEGLGSYWKGQASEICAFLRNCRWGSGPSFTELVGSVVKHENSYWYRGELGRLKGDIPEQLRCVDRIKYHYEPELEIQPESLACILKVRMAGASKSLGPAAEWAVSVEVTKWASEHGPEAAKLTATLQPDGDFDDLDYTAEEWVTFQLLTADEVLDSQGMPRIWAMEIKVEAKVDVAGDSRHIVEQKEDTTFTYKALVPTPTPRPQFDHGTPGPSDAADAGVPSPEPVGSAGAADVE